MHCLSFGDELKRAVAAVGRLTCRVLHRRVEHVHGNGNTRASQLSIIRPPRQHTDIHVDPDQACAEGRYARLCV